MSTLKSSIIFFILTLSINLSLTSGKSCNFPHSVNAVYYTGDENDPVSSKISSVDELKDAYRVEIIDSEIPEVCDEMFRKLTRLDTLKIINSGVEKLGKRPFGDALRILDISNNKIKEVKSDVFIGLNLRRVNLTSNRLEKIESNAFDDMKNLMVMELGENKLKEIDGEWFKNSKLYRITLENNKITELRKDSFKFLKNANGPVDIWLMNNEIVRIHYQSFKDLSNIGTLWLSNNKIEVLNDLLLEDAVKIESLHLDGNKLECITNDFLESLNKVAEIDIDNNPLDCGCLRSVRKWGAKKGVEIMSARRGFDCLREKISDVINSQKNYYEKKFETREEIEKFD